MGIWRIELVEEQNNFINYLTKTFSDLLINPKESNIVKKLTSPKVTFLSNKPEKMMYYVDLIKIKSVPIFAFKMIENMIVIVGKKNNNGSSVSLEFLHGVIKVDKNNSDSETNFSDDKLIKNKNNNLDIKYQELKNNSVHAINEINDSSKIKKKLEGSNEENVRMNSMNNELNLSPGKKNMKNIPNNK